MIHTKDGTINAKFSGEQQITVLNTAGQILDRCVASNQYSKTFPQGMYIVKIGKDTHKIVLKTL